MNRRMFLSQVRTCALAGAAIGFAPNLMAQELRPAVSPPRIAIAQPVESPVTLRSVRIEAEISGSRALTTVEMEFFNPNRRVLEGELQFPLLDGQQVVGFALDIDGKLRDAVPVEKAKGQQVFEDVIRQRIDPALLQTTLGNNYKLRVYPLPAQGTRRVQLRYAETVPAKGNLRNYRLPLDYAQTLPGFSLRVMVRAPETMPAIGGAPESMAFKVRGVDYEAEIARRDYAARGVLEINIPAATRPEVRTQLHQDKNYFVAEVPAPAMASVARKLPAVIGIVWDASGSGAERDHVREFALLDAYFERMGNGEARLTRVRDTAEPVQRFRIANGDWRELRRVLETTPYDGATQLGAFTPESGVGEYLLFTDGLDNFGERPLAKMEVPLYTINAANRADPAKMRQVAETSGGRFIDLTAITAADAGRALLADSTRILNISAEGATALTVASRHADQGRWLVAGQLTSERALVKITVGRTGATPRTIDILVPGGSNGDSLAAAAWAQQRLAALESEPRLNRAEIRRIGLAFNIPTRETSLIVLDRIEDYVRNDIVPPAELRAEFDRLRRNQHLRADQDRVRQIDRVAGMFKEKVQWWEREFPKADKPKPQPEAKISSEGRRDSAAPNEVRRMESDRMRATGPLARQAPAEAEARPAAPPAASTARPMRELAAGSANVADRLAKDDAGADTGNRGISIQLKRWTPDAPYFARFRDASREELYRAYLDERPGYLNSTAFFLDAADAFFDKGLTELGVRVLTNLAEMDLENRHILRILGYRLMQANQPKLAIPVLARVLELAPDEPQSYRDLGLAYAADKQWQKAVDNLNEVVIRPWHGRFPEIELIALAELNAIVANPEAQLDTSRIDPRLLRNLPLDLRVILAWDADNTDIDLWVTDPNGEKAYYGNRLTYQGGRMSQDFTGGYGPEEFSLKHAKPGKYKVEANFYGHRQQVVAGATTLQMKLATRFGTRQQQEQIVTLRLKGQNEVVFVGEFEVK